MKRNPLIDQYLAEYSEEEIAQAQRDKDKQRQQMLDDLESSLKAGEPIGGRLRWMVEGIKSLQKDGLSMEILSNFAASHNLELGDVLQAAQARNPQEAIMKLLRGE